MQTSCVQNVLHLLEHLTGGCTCRDVRTGRGWECGRVVELVSSPSAVALKGSGLPQGCVKVLWASCGLASWEGETEIRVLVFQIPQSGSFISFLSPRGPINGSTTFFFHSGRFPMTLAPLTLSFCSWKEPPWVS